MSDTKLKLDEAYQLASKEKDYVSAIEACNQIIAEYPERQDGLNTRGRIYELMGNLTHAIQDISKVIEIEPNQPDHYFTRGRWNLGLGNLVEAVSDQTKALEIGASEGLHYYDECAYLFRAAGYVGLGEFENALSDCEHVEDDFLMYSTGIGKLTKQEIVRRATDGLKR